ncbi:MAG: hypothetical protein JSV19_03665, partial [Phycisphaerales bacterium]
MNTKSDAASKSQSRLATILEDYLAAVERGTRPDREALLAEHPDLAEELEACLATLDFMRRVDVGSADGATPKAEAAGQLGDYRIVREIGRGGMGVVYDAWQNSMDRQVALKVLPVGLAADNKAFMRFMREAKTAG